MDAAIRKTTSKKHPFSALTFGQCFAFADDACERVCQRVYGMRRGRSYVVVIDGHLQECEDENVLVYPLRQVAPAEFEREES